MAALLPTILSDDEAEYDVTTKSNSSSKKKRASEKKAKQTKTPKINVDSDDDGDSSNDEMDGDFEFGGILVSSQQSWLVHIMYASFASCIHALYMNSSYVTHQTAKN